MCWRYRIIALFMMLAMLCGGCMGSREIDEVSFVLTIGVDKSDEPEMFVFTFRIAMPKSFAGDGGGENKEKTKLVSVKAPSINEAIRQLAVAMNRRPEMSHASALFVHEDVARDGIYDLVSLFLRSKVYRNTMVVLVTEDKAKETMEKNTSPFELFQYRWVDSVRETQKMAASYLMNDVRAFYVKNSDPQRAVITAYGTVIDKSLDKKGLPPLNAQTAEQYTISDFPREGGTELIVVGSAIFSDWKMIGKLNTSEAFGANILREGAETLMTIPDPVAKGKHVSMGIQILKPKINVDVKDGKMTADINARVICELADASSGVDYTKKENRAKLENQMSEAVKSSLEAYFKATQPLAADCVQVTNAYRRKARTWQEWEQLDWPALYQQADIRVSVDTSMKRSGLLWRYKDGSEEL